ncbi:hypothetical protein SDC9_77660 [bioreactor metagenome]|uniref:5-bromo-4-chloroindolyl phosphate hydrolysis protein n=1 Tax=bioreactor metagenome TaxID=1076179 RepID=A0A644YS26_9ZZZZ
MAIVKKKSVLPIYAAAAVWLVFGLFLPLYQLSHYVTATLISLAAFLVGRAVWPDKTFTVADPEPAPKPTGNPELDALIKERDRAVSEMRRLNDSIEDKKLSDQIDDLEATTRKIIDHVVGHPAKLSQIRKFMSYYLPTTLKLLNAYDRMGAAGVEGQNIGGTMGKIDKMMDTVVQAFHRQLDALFGDEALDISSDITVMENLLAREGIGGMQMPTE